jgi:hypothetical protein
MPLIEADPTVQIAANKSADLTAKKAGDLALATVHLYTNNHTPVPGDVVANFTEAAFTGYAAKAIPGWTANDVDVDGSVSSTGTTVLTWTGPADASGQTVYGYYILSVGGGTPIIAAALFTAPVGMNGVGDILDMVPTFRLP